MIDERTETQASLYALGALPPDEAREFEAAMRRDPRLRALVEELQDAADAMTAGFPRVAPQAELKAKVMAAIDSRPTPAVVPANVADLDPARLPGWMAWMPWALAACFAVLCVVLISVGKNMREQALSLSEQLDERNAEAADLKNQLDEIQALASARMTNYERRIFGIETQVIARIAELNRQTAALTNQLFREHTNFARRLAGAEDDVRRYAATNRALLEAIGGMALSSNERFSNARIALMRPTSDGPAATVGASVWIPGDQRGLLVLEKLPAVQNAALQDYQLWLIGPDAPTPVSAGVFLPDGSGAVRLQYNAAVSVRTVDKFAVTVEPKGGVPQPTGKIILLSN